MHKNKIFLFGFFVIACAFTGCAVTSSGNMVGEAAAVKYSTSDKKYHIAEVGIMYASSSEDYISTPHHEVYYEGGSLNLKASLYSFNYSLWGQKGGVFLSVPISIPLDIGVRPSFIQWIGPAYLGAGISFAGGFYPNEQDDDYEPKADNSIGYFDGFILYNFGSGVMFDIGEKFALGAYANYERVALNSGGSNVKEYGFYMDIMSETHGKENLPAYARRVDMMTLGLNAFIKMKNPLGFYAEYSPEKLMYNDGWRKFRIGAILLY